MPHFYLRLTRSRCAITRIKEKSFSCTFLRHKFNIPVSTVAVAKVVITAPLHLAVKQRYYGIDLILVDYLYSFSVMIDLDFTYLRFVYFQQLKRIATEWMQNNIPYN